jgi:hypothetical protein
MLEIFGMGYSPNLAKLTRLRDCSWLRSSQPPSAVAVALYLGYAISWSAFPVSHACERLRPTPRLRGAGRHAAPGQG